MNENKKESGSAEGSLHGKEYEIPVLGSLGLLALGYRGLELWRKKREEAKLKKNETGDER